MYKYIATMSKLLKLYSRHFVKTAEVVGLNRFSPFAVTAINVELQSVQKSTQCILHY